MSLRWRRLIVFSGASLFFFLLAAALVHTASVRSRALAWLAARARADAGIELEAEGLDYNLLTLSFRITKVRLKAEAGRLKPAPTNEAPTNEAGPAPRLNSGQTNAAPPEVTPFFEADEVTVDLPWSAIRGALAIESLHLTRPRVTLVRGTDGALNLPKIRARRGKPLDLLPIGRLVLTDGAVSYADPQRTLSISVSGLDASLTSVGADLGRPDGSVTPVGADFSRPGAPSVAADFSRPGAGIAGTLVAREGLHIDSGANALKTTRFDARVAYDGSTLSVDPLTLTAREGALELKGRLTLLGAPPRVEASYRSTVDVGLVAHWWPAAGPLSGTVAVTGRLSGLLARPALTAEFAGGVAGGTVTGTGRLSASGDAPENVVAFDYQDLDLAHVLTAARVTPLPRLAARLDGRGQASWRAPRLDTLRVTLENEADPSTGSGQGASTRLGQDVRARALGVDGRLALQIDRGAWTLHHSHRFGSSLEVSGVAQGRIDGSVLSRTSLSGDATVRARDLFAALTALDAAGVETSPLADAGISGDARADLALGGTLASPGARGTVEVADFRTSTSGPAHLAAQIDVDTDRLRFEDLDLVEGANRLQASGRIEFARRALTGDVHAEAPAVADWLRAVPSRWRPVGTVTAAGRMGGTLGEPRLDLTITGRAIDIAGQRIDRLTADARLIGDTVFVKKGRLTQGEAEGGHLVVAGRYAIRSGEYSVKLSGADLDVRPIPPPDADAPPIPIAARADVEFEGTGSIERPAGRGRLRFHQLSWDRVDAGPARAEVALDGNVARISASAPDLRLTLDLSALLAAPHRFTVTGAVNDGDVARWVNWATGPDRPVSGVAALKVEASGDLDRLSAAEAELALERLELGLGRGRLELVRPARVRYASGQVAASGVEFRSGDTTLTAGGLLTSRPEESALSVTVDGDLHDVGPWLAEIASRDLDVRGALRGRLTASGSVTRPIVEGDLAVEAGTLAIKDLPPLTALGLRAVFRDGVLDVSSATGEWQGATITASGRLPATLFERWVPKTYLESLPPGDRLARVAAKAAPITEAALAPWLGAESLAEIDVEAAATVTAESDALALNRLRGELTLDRLSLSLARVRFDQQRPTRATLAGGRLSIADWTWGGSGNQVTVSGGVQIDGEPRVEAQARGVFDLRMLGAFLPGVATAGRADVDLRARGDLRNPELAGMVAVSGGEVQVRDPRLAITDLAGTLTLAGNHLVVRNATGSANGGSLRLDGDFRIERFALADGSLSAVGRGVAFQWPKGLRTEIDADLTLAVSSAAPSLGGKVTVQRGAYRDPIVLTTQVLEALKTVAPAGAEADTTSLASRLRLDVAVVTAADVSVDNNYGQMQIAGDLRLVGTPARQGLAGRATVREGGKLFLGGNVYRLQRGTIDFLDPAVIEPDLNFAAETRVGSYTITLTVSGKPDTLTAELTSDDPALTQMDLVSLLVTGRRASDVGLADSQQLRSQMLRYLSGDLLGLAGQRIGFDTVRLDRGTTGDLFGVDPALLASETDPGARLSVSKNLSRQVEIVLSQSLREKGGLTWIAIYRPSPSLELRGITRDDGSRAAEFSQRLTFGGGPRAGGPAAGGARVERPRVAGVALTGLPPPDERDARSRLSLGRGDRFDFYRWQDDRDALEAFLRDRGYLEARVSARREDTGEECGRGVALKYEVALGPRTVLTIEGARLPDRVVRELRDAWASAVFDGFLIDDLRSRIAAYLASEGHLQATVTAGVRRANDDGSPRKDVLVQITSGPRAARRAIAFTGNAHVSSATLQAFLKERGLDAAAWLTPADVESALVGFYRSQGHLIASVVVGALRLETDAATLPVTIVEGPVFRVSAVRVEGIHARSAEDVRRIFTAAGGATYEPGQIEVGRRAVEAAYRRDGFDAVTARVATEIDREAAQVAVTLQVTEGTRAVLADVVVSGARTTAGSVVARALRAEPGMPIDQDAWYQARKRLYDTGVFQSADIRFEPSGAPVASGAVVEQPMRARVALEEWPPYRLRYGFHLGDEIAPSGEGRDRTLGVVADLQHRNLFGRAIAAGVIGRVENDLWLGRGFVTTPRTFGVPVGTSLFLTRSHETANPEGAIPFVHDKTTVTVEQQARAPGGVKVSYGYRYEFSHVFDPKADPDDPFAIDVPTNTARMNAALVVDRRDDPFNATRGWFQSSNLEYASPTIGSDLRFVKYLLQASYFRPAGAAVAASNLRFGGVRAFDQEVILTERFLAGGSTTVRGYKEDSLGPVFFGEPAGGNAMLVFNQEVRFPVYRWIRGVGFVDAGNVFPLISDVTLSDLKVGVGLGARLDTPFGLFRVDFGVPVPRPATGPRGRWYFSLGHVF